MIVAEPDVDLEATLAASRAVVAMHDDDREPGAERRRRRRGPPRRRAGHAGADGSRRTRAADRSRAAGGAVRGRARRSAPGFRGVGARCCSRELDLTPEVRTRRRKAHEALVRSYEAEGRWMELALTLEELAAEPGRAGAGKASFRGGHARCRGVDHQDGRRSARPRRRGAHVVDTYGSSRVAHAAWLPLLERERDWATYERVLALRSGAGLAERTRLHARAAGSRAAPADAATCRRRSPRWRGWWRSIRRSAPAGGTLERLLGDGDHRLAAAEILEPLYRTDNATAGAPSASTRCARATLRDIEGAAGRARCGHRGVRGGPAVPRARARSRRARDHRAGWRRGCRRTTHSSRSSTSASWPIRSGAGPCWRALSTEPPSMRPIDFVWR